jgi:hypothetical protein
MPWVDGHTDGGPPGDVTGSNGKAWQWQTSGATGRGFGRGKRK